jgi:hypothetical protein
VAVKRHPRQLRLVSDPLERRPRPAMRLDRTARGSKTSSMIATPVTQARYPRIEPGEQAAHSPDREPVVVRGL